MNRRVVKRGVVSVAVGGLLTGLLVAGAGAEPTLTLPSPKPTDAAAGDSLKVVIGKTVAVTTDQNGRQTPFNLMLINGQVSGTGQGEIKIPTGTDSAKTVDVESKPGQVHNFFDLGGSYGGDLPVTISTAVKVNGETVDPNKAYNLTGDVEVTYTFVNHTARKQKITYKDIYGKSVTKELEIPVPFGNSFAVTYGDGWSVKDAGPMSADVTPNGTALSTSVILFPIVPGVVGGTTQTLTVKAQADNASLPSVKNTMVPVQLGTYMGGILLGLEPAVQQSLMQPLNSMVGGLAGNITSAASLISGYTGGFESLAKNYIDPLIREIDKVRVNPNRLRGELTELGTGLENLGALMVANRAAQQRVANLIKGFASVVGMDVPQLVKWLGKVVKDLGPSASQASKGLIKLKTLLDKIDLAALPGDLAPVDAACVGVGPTADFYGYQGTWLQSGGKGADSLQSVLKANKKEDWAKALAPLQSALDSQAEGTLIPKSQWMAASLLPDTYKDLLRQPACQTIGALSGPLSALGTAWGTLGPVVGDLAVVLAGIAELAKSPEAAKIYNETLVALQQVSKLLDNNRCVVSDVINPIINAIERYGAANISAHISEVLAGIFSKCGLAQIVQFFGDFDALIGRALTAFGQVVLAARADVPTIANAVDGVRGIADVVGAAFDAIPGLGAEVGRMIAGAGGTVDDMGTDLIGLLSGSAAEIGATLDAMNQRVLAGDGSPYGPATGVPGTVTMTAYQVTMQGAAPNSRNWATGLILAIIFLVIGAGVGTLLYSRHRRARLGSSGNGR